MRLLLVGLIALSSPAFAGSHSGGGGGGGGSGPLGQVSAGLATAVATGSAAGSTSAGTGGGPYTGDGPVVDRGDTGGARFVDCGRYHLDLARGVIPHLPGVDRECNVFWGDPNAEGGVHRIGSSPSEPGAWVTAFAGAQKVVGSDGSFSLAAAVVDRRFRLNGSFTQYYETEMTGDRITMMAPEISAGVNLGSDGPTRVWLESGVLYLKTSDPAGGVSIAGPTVGTRIEHQISPDLSLAGAVEAAYLQDGVRGVSGRVSVRFHHLEAALRVLDLNVGPALYGPEVGVGF